MLLTLTIGDTIPEFQTKTIQFRLPTPFTISHVLTLSFGPTPYHASAVYELIKKVVYFFFHNGLTYQLIYF